MTDPPHPHTEITPIFISSNGPDAYHVNITTKAEFNHRLTNPITIPFHKQVYIGLNDAAIPNYFSNVLASSGFNKIYYTDDLLAPEKYSVTFPDGYYGIDDLNNRLKTAFIEEFAAIGAVIPFQFYGLDSEQKIQVQFIIGWQMYFKAADTIFSILGATSAQKLPASALSAAATLHETLPNQASLQSAISIHFHCSLFSGSTFNDISYDTIANVQLDVKAGSMVNYKPPTPLLQKCNTLGGSTISNFRVYLTDQSGNSLSLGGQNFDANIVLYITDARGNPLLL